MEFVRKRYNNLEYSFDEMISAFNDVIQVQNEIIEDYKREYLQNWSPNLFVLIKHSIK